MWPEVQLVLKDRETAVNLERFRILQRNFVLHMAVSNPAHGSTSLPNRQFEQRAVQSVDETFRTVDSPVEKAQFSETLRSQNQGTSLCTLPHLQMLLVLHSDPDYFTSSPNN
jgi:hypothetical protein